MQVSNEKHINEILIKHGVTSALSRKLFIDRITCKVYSKSSNLFVEGKKNDYEYILISGVLHRYNFSDQGVMVTTGF